MLPSAIIKTLDDTTVHRRIQAAAGTSMVGLMRTQASTQRKGDRRGEGFTLFRTLEGFVQEEALQPPSPSPRCPAVRKAHSHSF